MHTRTILFDLDGTLIDTNELIISSFLHTLNFYYPDRYSREDVLEFIGPPLKESFQSVDPERVDEMVTRYKTHNIENHNEYVIAYDGVFETLNKLRKMGIRLGIVTTKMRQTVEMGMKLTNIHELFDVIITLDDVTHAKPDPEPVLMAMKALGAKPEETMMVGDNRHDIEAGKNAKVKTAGVAWTIKGRDTLERLHPDFMLEHISDLFKIVGE